jgi:hypothetical protein
MAAKAKSPKKWSEHVTETSNALDIERGTFASDDPEQIAVALEKDAEASTRRKSSPYRSAMSMLTFYINRAGSKLSPKHRKVLEEAKDVLREQFGPQSTDKKSKKATAKKAPSKKKSARGNK